MGWIIPNCNLPFPSIFSYSGKMFVKEMILLSEYSFADAIKTKTFVNDSIVERLRSIPFYKLTTSNFFLFSLYCVCWRFSGCSGKIVKTFYHKVTLVTLNEMQHILEDLISVQCSKFGFFSTFRKVLQYKMYKKSDLLKMFGIKNIKQFPLDIKFLTNFAILWKYL